MVVGEREQSSDTVNVRARDDGSQSEMRLDDFLASVDVASPGARRVAVAAE
jgi:threonyl-tRNA synthetase